MMEVLPGFLKLYVHSAVSVALRVGLDPLNMSGRKAQWPVCVCVCVRVCDVSCVVVSKVLRGLCLSISFG